MLIFILDAILSAAVIGVLAYVVIATMPPEIFQAALHDGFVRSALTYPSYLPLILSIESIENIWANYIS